jgi:hypothetical protein
MNLLQKLKESGVSVAPILVIVPILHLTVAPLAGDMLARFYSGGALIILGLSIFLLGTDLGILPMGHAVGSALVAKKNLPLMLIAGFVVGFLVTVAEPDVAVLADQVSTVDRSIPRLLLILMIGLGVGFFTAVGFGRIVLNISYRWTLVLFYLIVFALAAFTDRGYLSVAFDAGGATTGPMTVPFIMALGVGVASVRVSKKSEEDSFGVVGLASIGPIMAVLIMGIVQKGRTIEAGQEAVSSQEALGVAEVFIHLLPETLKHVAVALAPLVVIFIVFQLTLIKHSRSQAARMAKGMVYTYIGLVLFFLGVNGGFLPVGSLVGGAIGGLKANGILIPIGLVLGAVVVLAEPAVWVLNSQIEEVSGGHIKKPIILATLSISISIAVAMAMLRIVTGMSIWWFLIPGYALALILTFFSPGLFTAIAFDSGGVASGPMSSTFVLSFSIGASAMAGGNPMQDAFGVIAMIAMMPLITIQILGILVRIKEEKQEKAAAITNETRAASSKEPIV